MRIPVVEIFFAAVFLWVGIVLVRHLWEVYCFIQYHREHRKHMMRKAGYRDEKC